MGASVNKRQGSRDKRAVISFKILVVGASQSGKTSVIHRYTSNQFRGNHEPTTLVELTTHTLKVQGRYLVPMSVTFWEIPSNPLPSMKEKYYNDADGVLVVADVSSMDLLKDALSWREDITSICTNQCLPFMLLLNKMDWNEMEKEDIADLKATSEENGFFTCVEVFPSNGGESVFRAVDGLLRLLVDQGKFYYQKDSFYPTSPIASHTHLATATRTLAHNLLPMDVHLTTGVQEQDDLLALCWKEITNVNHCISTLMKGVLNFEKESLYENLITSDFKQEKPETAIEYCIAGLRRRLPSSFKDHRQVFFKCGHEVLKLLYIYHTEIYPPANQLLQNIPALKTHIQSCKESLFKLQESEQLENEEAAGSDTNASKGDGSSIMDAAMGNVELWEREIELTLKKVKTLSQKIQVAALWNS